MTYYATSYTNAAHKTRVIVDSSESMSQGTMFDMTNNGYTCRRFITTEQAYIDYSNGVELDVAIVPGDNGRNFKRVVIHAEASSDSHYVGTTKELAAEFAA